MLYTLKREEWQHSADKSQNGPEIKFRCRFVWALRVPWHEDAMTLEVSRDN
jgi:hypothetical protein